MIKMINTKVHVQVSRLIHNLHYKKFLEHQKLRESDGARFCNKTKNKYKMKNNPYSTIPAPIKKKGFQEKPKV